MRREDSRAAPGAAGKWHRLTQTLLAQEMHNRAEDQRTKAEKHDEDDRAREHQIKLNEDDKLNKTWFSIQQEIDGVETHGSFGVKPRESLGKKRVKQVVGAETAHILHIQPSVKGSQVGAWLRACYATWLRVCRSVLNTLKALSDV